MGCCGGLTRGHGLLGPGVLRCCRRHPTISRILAARLSGLRPVTGTHPLSSADSGCASDSEGLGLRASAIAARARADLEAPPGRPPDGADQAVWNASTSKVT